MTSRATPTPSATEDTGLDVVTGAFSYSGRVIAARLLAGGRRVRTLTGHPDRAEPGSPVDVRPLDFDDAAGLAASLAGVTTLYNTYWVRFARGRIDHPLAVENSRTLFDAARRAGVRKIVHVSILHPSAASPYPYQRGKALVERALVASGIPYAVLRPSVLFDERCVLLNNIAWLVRRFPVFAVGGDGSYRLRPIHTDDLAALAVKASTWEDDRVVDAVGPDRPRFIDLVAQIREVLGTRTRIVRVPAPLILAASRLLGAALHDVLLTPDEYHAMAEGLADSDQPATGSIGLGDWLAQHADGLGARYANELDLHFR